MRLARDAFVGEDLVGNLEFKISIYDCERYGTALEGREADICGSHVLSIGLTLLAAFLRGS